MSEALHLYGFVRAEEPREYDAVGIGDNAHDVYLSLFGGIGGVVSDAESAAIEGTRRSLMAQSRVLEEVMRQGVVLPVRFGVVVPDEYTLQEKIMRPCYDRIDGLLTEMNGRAELILKAFYHEEAILTEIVEENPSVKELRDRVRKRPSDAAYYDKVRLGEMIAECMATKAQHDADRIVARLRPMTVSSKAGDTSIERMVVNASFLVDQSRIHVFDQAVTALYDEMEHRMRFKYLGPLPPYSFVDIPLPVEL